MHEKGNRKRGGGGLICSQCLWLKLNLRANFRGPSWASFLSRSGQRVRRVMVDQRLKEEMSIIGCVVEFMLFGSPVLMGLMSDKVGHKVVTDPSCCYFARSFPAYPVWACHSGPCPSCLPGVDLNSAFSKQSPWPSCLGELNQSINFIDFSVLNHTRGWFSFLVANRQCMAKCSVSLVMLSFLCKELCFFTWRRTSPKHSSFPGN